MELRHETTQVIGTENTDGNHLVYVPKYCDPEAPEQSAPDEAIYTRFTDFLAKLVPGFNRSEVLDWTVQRAKLVEPVRAIVGEGALADAPPADEYTARRLSVEAATLAAANQYRPEPYEGDVTLFLASEADKRSLDRPLDWAGYVLGDMEVFCGPAGCDGDTMLKEGSVGVFAEQLATRLEEAAPRTARGAHA